jgi:hypothetical protein
MLGARYLQQNFNLRPSWLNMAIHDLDQRNVSKVG